MFGSYIFLFLFLIMTVLKILREPMPQVSLQVIFIFFLIVNLVWNRKQCESISGFQRDLTQIILFFKHF